MTHHAATGAPGHSMENDGLPQRRRWHKERDQMGHRPKTATLSGKARVTVLAIMPLSVFLAANAAAAASADAAPRAGASHITAGPRHSLAYYNNNPCALLTRNEVEKVVHVRMGPGQQSPNTYGGSCNYQNTQPASIVNVGYAFNGGPAASVGHIKGAIHQERSVGHGAYCISTTEGGGPFAEILMNVGMYQGIEFSLEITLDTCAHGATLAEIALSRISS
jgi:hypothetical protein